LAFIILQAEMLAGEMLQQTAEMVLLECSATLRRQLKIINENLYEQCQVERPGATNAQ
jgi:hypothetical protein